MRITELEYVLRLIAGGFLLGLFLRYAIRETFRKW